MPDSAQIKFHPAGDLRSPSALTPKARTQLHQQFIKAVSASDIAQIEALVTDVGVDPNLRFGQPLALAINGKDAPVFNKLIELGASVGVTHFLAILREWPAAIPDGLQYLSHLNLSELSPNYKNAILIEAASLGRLDVVKFVFDRNIHGENIADIHADEDAALARAAGSGHLEIVKYFLDRNIHGENVANIRARESLALLLAVQDDHIDVVKYLLDRQIHGDSIAAMRVEEDYPLVLAAGNGHLDLIKYFLDRSIHGDSIADIHARDDQALELAVNNGHLDVVKYLLDRSIHGENIAEIHAGDDDVLVMAADEGQLDLIKYLLDRNIHGDNILDIRDGDDAPLRFAAENGHLDVVEYLLDRNIHGDNIADIHSENDEALYSAAERGHFDLVRYLLDRSIHGDNIANIHAKGDEALRTAAKNGYLDIVSFLLDKSIHGDSIANIHADDDAALCWAAEKGHLDVVEYLLDRHIHGDNIANINAQDDRALRCAAGGGQLGVVKYLLDKNIHHGKIANIHAMGDEPLKLAQKLAHSEVVEFLLLEIANESRGTSLSRYLLELDDLSFLDTNFQIVLALAGEPREAITRLPTAFVDCLAYRCVRALNSLYYSRSSHAAPEDLIRAAFRNELARIERVQQPELALRDFLKATEDFENLSDLVNEITDALVLGLRQEIEPELLGETITELLLDKREHARGLALEILTCSGSSTPRSLSELARWNRLWHRADKRLPVEARPVLALNSWDPLFEETQIGEYIVQCLTSQDELVREGSVENLDHCVGNGGYANACSEGGTQIVSIQNGKSVATLELEKGNSGELKASDGSFWRVSQFHGKGNSTPPAEAKKVWGEFVALCDAKKVALTSPEPSKTAELSEIPAICMFTGVYPGESCYKALEHYLGLYLIKKDGSREPLIRQDSPIWELIGAAQGIQLAP